MMEPKDHTVGFLVVVLILVWCWASSDPVKLTPVQPVCVCPVPETRLTDQTTMPYVALPYYTDETSGATP